VTLGVEFGQMGGQWFELEDYYCDFLGGLWYNLGCRTKYPMEKLNIGIYRKTLRMKGWR
jgi:hypothetical protein